MKHTMRVVIASLLLTGCTLFTGPGEVACGVWPYRAIGDAPARVVEELYAFDLLIFEMEPFWFAVEDAYNPWIGFFRPGEPIHLVRAGDINGRHVLVTLADDRFWTVIEEVCGG